VSNDTIEPLPLAPQRIVHPPIAVVEYPSFRRVLQAGANIMVDYAHAGTHEEGGNNGGDQVEFFQHLTGNHAGDAWCASSACTCAVKGFARLMGWAEDRESLLSYVGRFGKLYMPVTGYVPTIWAEAVARKIGYRKKSKHHPQPGCLILYDFHQQGEPHHVGYFLQTDPEGTVKDVSGNTGPGPSGNQADGDGVYVRHRSTDRIWGWIDP
jgi:hypothetical protein